MNRSDVLIMPLGGGGGRLGDEILNQDPRFQGFFVNTSMTDLESCENVNQKIKNYYCISTQNGVGRDRELGKDYASQYGYSILDMISKYQQKVIWMVVSFGGGSGSAILSVLLNAIEQLGSEFDKVINLIGILPNLTSPDVILNNTIDTWSEVIASKSLNSMIFVSNDSFREIYDNENDKELAINESFANTFNSIFDIPEINGIKFDNGNLTNLLTNKGCLYFYDLPSGHQSVQVALRKAEQHSVLAKMFKTERNTELLDDGTKAIKCGYLGVSFADEEYNTNYIENIFKASMETYVGVNYDKNLVLMSGCLPPFNVISTINYELEDRAKRKYNSSDIDYSQFIVKKSSEVSVDRVEESSVRETQVQRKSNKIVQKAMKKNLFKRP